MLNWVDFAIVGLFAAALILEVKRGFGRAVFDFAALLAAVKFTPTLADRLSHALQFTAKPSTNEAAIYLVLFFIIGGALVFLGKLVYDTTLISAETFDALLGGMFGIGIAIILCHAFARTIALSAGSLSVPPAVIIQSAFGTEFLNFESYHRLLEVLYNFHRVD